MNLREHLVNSRRVEGAGDVYQMVIPPASSAAKRVGYMPCCRASGHPLQLVSWRSPLFGNVVQSQCAANSATDVPLLSIWPCTSLASVSFR